MIFKIVLIATLGLFASECLATAQAPDIIVIENQEYFLNTNPLEPYLRTIDWKPPEDAAIWSSNWRGYIATWSIENNNLILVDVTIEIRDETSERKRISILKTLFPKDNNITANWFSGNLIIPTGEITTYVHMGYGSMYHSYKIYKIKKGQVKETINLDEAEFIDYKEKKFSAFKQTEFYKNEFNELTTGKNKWSDESADEFLKSIYAEDYLSHK